MKVPELYYLKKCKTKILNILDDLSVAQIGYFWRTEWKQKSHVSVPLSDNDTW